MISVAIGLANIVGHLSQGLVAQVDRVRSHIGDVAALVQPLGDAHGRLSAVAEAIVGILL